MDKELIGSIELNRIYQMNCLEGMKLIPDGSIDMILCDLPYGTVKNMGIDGWKNKGEDCAWDNKLDNKSLFEQYERILRENGIIILFSQEPYTSELRSYNAENIEFAYPLVWKKDHFANALIAKKAPVSYFEDLSVFYKKYDTQNLNPLRTYFKNIAEYIGITSCKQINEKLGHRRAEHSFYIFDKNKTGGSTQFKLCTEETYNELISVFQINKMKGFMTFEKLLTINNKYQRVFNLLEGKKFIGNVLEFKKDYQGLHPTQKPVKLCSHLIKIYTNENDIILDNCIGSGTTAVAATINNRKWIGFETESKYIELANKRLEQIQLEDNLNDYK